MLGIFLTLVAVLFVICIAFYFSDNPDKTRADALFFLSQKGSKRNAGKPRI